MQKSAAFRSAVSRRERSSNFELFAWFFMRVSGIILLFIALFHLYYMHFVVDVATINFMTIAERWHGPNGVAWRTFDFALLFFSFTHGTNGVRYVIEDYLHHDGMRVAAKTGLYLLYFLLMAMGTYVIIAFDSAQYIENRESISALFQLIS
jgi:succinate dehydrogenase / fumarate reductase, membrane anchor subunit